MKKLLAAILTLSLSLSCFASCGSSEPAPAADTKSQAEYECGKKAYDELIKASEICTELGDGLYNAWFFAIYEADDYSGSTRVLEFADKVGISSADIFTAAEELGVSGTILNYALEEFSLAVALVTTAYEKNGTTEKLNTALTNAKNELKTMTAEFSDYSQYPTLKSLYSEVDSYATFLKSPDGSFEQLKTTIENYETKIRTYKSDLSFVFD